MNLVWIVTFRRDAKSSQESLIRYTEEAAVHFAQGIIDTGGVAIVTEDLEDDSPTNDEHSVPVGSKNTKLIW